MHYHQPPWSGYPPTSHPPAPPAGGHESMFMGALMGELKAGQQRTIYVLELIHARLETNARIMEERLPGKPGRSLDDRLRTMREIIKTLVPLSLLAAIIMGKLTWLEAWPLIRQSLGLGG